MGEISGFGENSDPQGMAYEECCQDMLEAGVLWLKDNPNPDLQMKTLDGVYGIAITEPDSPADQMSKVILEASKGEATGGMHQAVMERLFYISANGWVKYCEELRRYRQEERNERQGNGSDLEESGETGSADPQA